MSGHNRQQPSHDLDPPSSPLEPPSSPLEPPSSPPDPDPPSSPIEVDPPSSPVEVEPPSSPADSELRSSPPSSPEVELVASPPHSAKRRRIYEFNDLEVSRDPKFWPHNDPGTTAFESILCESGTPFLDDGREPEGEENNSIAESIGEFHDNVTLSDISVDSSSDSDISEEDPNDGCERREELSFSSSTSSSSSASSSLHSDEDNTDDEDSSDSSISSSKVYRDCDLSVREGVVTLMDLFIDNKLTKTALGSIVNAVQKFLPQRNLMPNSRHQLFKYITDRAPPVPVTEHFYCEECLFYLGNTKKKCGICGNESKVFYQLCLESQLRNLFEHHNLAQVIDKYTEAKRNKPNLGYSDFSDGHEYKRAHVPGKYNLTLLGHTDGIQISESSNVALWPLEWAILETPHHYRFNYILVSGIWVDESHPYMNTFLKPFVDEMKLLYETGVKWIHPKTKKEEISIVVAPVFCADGPVRADIQNILHHGGRYCCHVCEQKMVLPPVEPIPPGCDKAPPRRRVFQLQEHPSKLRTAERMLAQGKRTLELLKVTNNVKPVKGVKGNAVIASLPKCDRSTAVYPEYMHLLLGIMRLFLDLWFDGDKDAPWSLKKHKDKINEFLKSVQLPDFITRTPRTLDCYSQWKCNELRTFLLYLSLIILKDCMSEVYFQHWMLFVGAMFLLLQESIPESDVTKAEILLKMFLRDFSRLYTGKKFTYNLHELLHLGHVTRLWGPSYLNSAFWFESFNGALSKCIHGTKEQGKELVNTIQLIKSVQILKGSLHQNDDHVSVNAVEFVNKVIAYKFSARQRELIKSANLAKPFNVYYRAKRNGEKFTSNIYSRQKRRVNYMVRFRSVEGESFGEIICFVQSIIADVDQKMAFVKKYSVDHLRMFIHRDTQFVIPHIVPITETDEIFLIPMTDVLFKVIRVHNYVCLRPNKIEINL